MANYRRKGEEGNERRRILTNFKHKPAAYVDTSDALIVVRNVKNDLGRQSERC